MTAAGKRRPASPRLKAFLLIAGPLLVAAGAGFGNLATSPSLADPRALNARGLELQEAISDRLERFAAIADRALQESPRAAWDHARRSMEDARRLEGVGLLGPGPVYQAWEGAPAEPPPRFTTPDWPRFTVRVEGVRTRLLVRGGPAEDGRATLASFIIDSTLDDLGFVELIPERLQRGVRLEATLLDSEIHRRLRHDAADRDHLIAHLSDIDPSSRVASLRSPDGELLGAVALSPIPSARRSDKAWATGRAAALCVFLLLAAVLFDWSRLPRSAVGLSLVVTAVALARIALVWLEVPSRLLPRSLGAPSFYGSTGMLDLLASPSDLLLTSGAVYLIWLAIRRFCATSEGGGARVMLLATLAGSAATLFAVALTVSLVRNSRVPLLDRPAPFQWDTRLLLWLGLFLVLLAAADAFSVAAAGRRVRAGADSGTSMWPRIGALLLLSAGAGLLLQQQSERIAVEQLSSELAAQVLDQGSRREVALNSAIHEVMDGYEGSDHAADHPGSRPEFLAYHHWVDGDLFHSRFKSSLGFYAPDGRLLSRFGFGIPPLDEPVPQFDDPEAGPRWREEWIDSIAVHPRLLHAEAPIFRDGRLEAIVVGHVLDEPDNLPFLPWSETYLAALGPGAAPAESRGAGRTMQYVLYDAAGSVRLTTLLRPPGRAEALAGSDGGRSLIRLSAGDEPYLGLALPEEDGRMHLLLLPRLTLAERTAIAVRLALFGILLVASGTLAHRLARPGGTRALVALMRGSFYRKLLIAVLVASVLPLVGLGLFLRGYVERRGNAELVSSATQFVRTAQRVVEDYSAETDAVDEVPLNDAILHWLRRVVGQEIHVYRNGILEASSTRELFASGLLPLRIDGAVQRRLTDEGLPYVVAPQAIGAGTIPVAYATVREPGAPVGTAIVAVPLVLEQREIARGVSRVGEMILMATVVLAGLLAFVAAALARTVARPVGELVEATARIAGGDYSARLDPRTGDEVANLGHGFNFMASALSRQRSDLERRRDYIETLLRHATTGVISLDTEDRIVTLNPAAQTLLDPEERRLKAGDSLHAALAAAPSLQPLAEAMQRTDPGETVEVDLVRGQESRRLRWIRVVLQDAKGRGFGTMVLLDDVTDLMRSNQLAAWAEMARAIAHEIKNPLTPIQLSAEHLRRLLDDRKQKPSPDEEACLETIINQVRALYDIAGEFSTYAKLPALVPEPMDPVAFMRGAIGPYRASRPQGITFREAFDAAPAVAIDGRVLTRAVVNLVENALQAMPDGGTLTLGVTTDAEQDRVCLSVADTGAGLEPEVRARLFEPYFSTKSSGTGLGLAIARRAVEAHGGTIDVAAGPEGGTVFHIRLPIHA